MWIVLQKKVEHNFKMIGELVGYSSEINGYIIHRELIIYSGVQLEFDVLQFNISVYDARVCNYFLKKKIYIYILYVYFNCFIYSYKIFVPIHLI